VFADAREERTLRDLILRMSARLAGALEDDVDAGVDEALALVGAATGADRAYVMTFDHGSATFSNTHEWTAACVSRELERLQGHPLALLDPWNDAFAAGEAVVIESLDALPPGGEALRKELAAQGVASALWVPLPAPHAPLGFVGFDAVGESRHWHAAEIDLLRAAGNVIAGSLVRARAAAERDQASARLRTLADLVPGAVYQYQVEADGRVWYPYASPGVKTLVGLDPEALRRDGALAFERIHPDDLETLMAANERSRVELSLWSTEFRVRDAHDAVRWVRGQATPERLTSGATLWHGVLIDVTEERALADALQERRSVLARITETLRDIVVLTDAQMTITYVSPSIEPMLGHRVQDVLGQHVTSLLPEAELALAEQHVANGFRDRDGSTLVHRVRHADGSERYVETLIHLLDDGAVFSARDVSDRMANQVRLEQEAAFRAALVALTNDMLGQALDEGFYQRVLERTIELVPDAQGGSMLLQEDDGTFRFVAAVEFDLGALAALRLTPDEIGPRSPSVERIEVRDTEGRLSPDKLDAFARAGRLLEISATLSVPITIGGVARGYMNLDNFERRDAFAGDSHEIAAALTAQVGIALQRLQLERGLEAERRRYERLASHDALTGLPNRRLFQDRLEQTVARAHRRKAGVALLYLDLDGFKDVNDTLGHDVGDELLAAVAKRLVDHVRAEDTVARLGGDEFGVILSDVAQREDAGLVAAKLGEAIDAPFSLRGRNVLVGVSIGIALYPDDARLSDGLMKAADVAMYRVKQQGKGSFAFFSRPLGGKEASHADD